MVMAIKMAPSAFSPFLIVTLTIFAMALFISLGFFDDVVVETGFEHYSEKPLSRILPWLEFQIMPANTLVNVAYVVVGLRWFHIGRTAKPLKNTKNADIVHDISFFLQCFSLLCIYYGPIQFLRIVTQTPRLAVLDQWVTLPFFSWVACWCFHFLQRCTKRMMLLMCIVSVLSYLLALLTPIGFEITLGIHIMMAIYGASCLQACHGNASSFAALVKACLCCAGFVFLKLYDKELMQWGIVNILGGHFWSKICDALQIHYACVLIYEIATHSFHVAWP